MVFHSVVCGAQWDEQSTGLCFTEKPVGSCMMFVQLKSQKFLLNISGNKVNLDQREKRFPADVCNGLQGEKIKWNDSSEEWNGVFTD